MVSVSFCIGLELRPIFSFGFGIGPKPKRWFQSYTTSSLICWTGHLDLSHEFIFIKVLLQTYVCLNCKCAKGFQKIYLKHQQNQKFSKLLAWILVKTPDPAPSGKASRFLSMSYIFSALIIIWNRLLFLQEFWSQFLKISDDKFVWFVNRIPTGMLE